MACNGAAGFNYTVEFTISCGVPGCDSRLQSRHVVTMCGIVPIPTLPYGEWHIVDGKPICGKHEVTIDGETAR